MAIITPEELSQKKGASQQDSYDAWRGKLPENLKGETPDYDLKGAYEAGMAPVLAEDGTYHLQSRDPKTGRILKSENHPSFRVAIEEDAKAGYKAYKGPDGKVYTLQGDAPKDYTPYSAGTTPPQEPVNTSITTETTDLEPINKVLQAMQAEGLTYGQAYDKYYPKPTRNTANEQAIRKQQKLALFSDMLRLVTEGVGAAGGATIAQRDQRNPYAGLQARLMQEYSTYAKNMQDWQSKGVDAAMKDLQMRSDMYRNAPKTRTTVQNNEWDKTKFTAEQAQEKAKMKQALEISDKDRAAANQRAAASAENKDPKVTQLTFADGNGTAVIPNNAYKGLMSAAYQAMLNDPQFDKDFNELEAINNKYDFEGKAAKIQAYVEQHAHESPAAQNLIRNNAQQYTRSAGGLAPSFEKNKEPSLLLPSGDRLILPRKKITGSLLPK